MAAILIVVRTLNSSAATTVRFFGSRNAQHRIAMQLSSWCLGLTGYDDNVTARACGDVICNG
ncbi:hypothetical protein APY04_0872 [Hyphomicrobium sulfonivorans]|uniref:Uncharacterized protein n=1 Tax=Hyphomicrobium sulfonivorans TaxID=121290 RepID=A0A109BMA1_HYPSL|nr:hypothetical protein APY04_0872 [Hyphomicrobium sulfonivorans]